MDTTPHSCGRRGHHPTELLKPPVGALGPSRSLQAAAGSGNSCQPSAHRLEPEGVELLLAQDLPAGAHGPVGECTGFPSHSPCGNASPASRSRSPPTSDEPPGRRPRSPRIRYYPDCRSAGSHCPRSARSAAGAARGEDRRPIRRTGPPHSPVAAAEAVREGVGACSPTSSRRRPRRGTSGVRRPAGRVSKLAHRILLLPH